MRNRDPYELKNLFDVGQFEKIVMLGTVMYDRSDFTPFEYRYLARALNKMSRYDDVVSMKPEFDGKYPDDNHFDLPYAWALYYKRVCSFLPALGDKSDFIDAITEIVTKYPKSVYFPAWKCVAKFYNTYVSGAANCSCKDLLFVMDMLDLFDLEELSDQAEKLEDGTALASPRESWYYYRIYSLFHLKRYDECVAAIDNCFGKNQSFSFNRDEWALYYKGCCLNELDRHEEAEPVLLGVLQRGKIKHANIVIQYYRSLKAQNKKIPFSFAGAELLRVDDLSHYDSFCVMLGNYLAEENKTRDALLHYRLAEKLFEENGKAVVGTQTYPPDIASMSMGALLHELYPLWRQYYETGKIYRYGIVINILPNGNDGFIKDDEDGSYHFYAKDFRDSSDMAIGLRVKYTLVDRLDKKHNVVKPNATDISAV